MDKSAAGGWPQPREYSPAFRIVVGVIAAILIVGGMVALIMYTIDNADKVPLESGGFDQTDLGAID